MMLNQFGMTQLPQINPMSQISPLTNNYSMYNQNNVQNLIRVNGIEGAKAYQMYPNSTVALFDNNDDIMYIKTTDGANFPSIRKFAFTEVQDNTPAQKEQDYVTRTEFEQLKEELLNGKQSISRTKSITTDKSTNN